jgi:monoamine oxidase
VIIGAGASGAAAAERLLASSFGDFLILEARDRVGGRIHSFPDGDDLNAHQLHNTFPQTAAKVKSKKKRI